jgi:hypothetical protein
MKLWFGFLSIFVFILTGCSMQSSYDVNTSMKLFTDEHGEPLIPKVAELEGYFVRGRPLLGPLVKFGIDKPVFSIKDPKKIKGFFKAMWAPSPFIGSEPPLTDGLNVVVIMKDPRALPAYFHVYMSNGHLILITPLTGRDAATLEAGELDKYLRANFPDASWLR